MTTYTDTQLLDALSIIASRTNGVLYYHVQGEDVRNSIHMLIENVLSPDERPALPTQPTQLQRLTTERDNLSRATQALKLFMMTDTYKALERVPQDLLAVQSRYMHGYLSVLEQRVNYYEDLV